MADNPYLKPVEPLERLARECQDLANEYAGVKGGKPTVAVALYDLRTHLDGPVLRVPRLGLPDGQADDQRRVLDYLQDLRQFSAVFGAQVRSSLDGPRQHTEAEHYALTTLEMFLNMQLRGAEVLLRGLVLNFDREKPHE